MLGGPTITVGWGTENGAGTQTEVCIGVISSGLGASGNEIVVETVGNVVSVVTTGKGATVCAGVVVGGAAITGALTTFGGAATTGARTTDIGADTVDGENTLGATGGTCCLEAGRDDVRIGA